MNPALARILRFSSFFSAMVTVQVIVSPTKTGARYSRDVSAARKLRRPPMCVSMLPVRRPGMVSLP